MPFLLFYPFVFFCDFDFFKINISVHSFTQQNDGRFNVFWLGLFHIYYILEDVSCFLIYLLVSMRDVVAFYIGDWRFCGSADDLPTASSSTVRRCSTCIHMCAW